MKAALLPCLALLALLIAPASAAPRFLVAGGWSPTGEFGFEGGWGFALGAEFPATPQASVLVRLDHHDLPDLQGAFVMPWSVGVVGAGPSDHRARLQSAMAGVRLHAPGGRVSAYVDALAGIGRLDLEPGDFRTSQGPGSPGDEDDSALALSFGSGLALGLVAGAPGRVFADAHLEWYAIEGMNSPLIPLRVGLKFP